MSQLARLVSVAAVLCAALLLAAGPVRADNERYAAFVVDENTGMVMHSRRSEDARYPASLTKMMTLYMLFEALDAGEIGLNDQIRVSQTAANAVPSRLGIPAGGTIRVEDAILALAVKSANDVAIAVGERLSGTETDFAADMTARAGELGMTNTQFRNASGLPHREQQTTARDMARLAVALHRDYPHYFHYFSAERFTWNGRTYRNHNSLVGRVEGVDGLKTGYINASGFNVVVSATRGENRLITVIMGGPTSAARDAHAEELLEAAFATLEQREDTRLFAEVSLPRINPVREQDLIARDVAALQLRGPTEMGSGQSAPPVRVVLADSDDMARPAAETSDRSVETAPIQAAAIEQPAAPRESLAGEPLLRGTWAIQVGAYNSADAAHGRLSGLTGRSAVLSQAQPAARAVDIDGDRLWRARFEALTEAEAAQACRDLMGRNEPCFTVAPGR